MYCVDEMSGASPYETLLVADAGDVYLTMYNVPQAVSDIHQQYTKMLSTGCKLLTIGGDHTVTYPILKAYRVRDELCRFIFVLCITVCCIHAQVCNTVRWTWWD